MNDKDAHRRFLDEHHRHAEESFARRLLLLTGAALLVVLAIFILAHLALFAAADITP